MKIAIYNLTTTTKSGGIETFCWGIAKHLARKGHAVHIYGGDGDIKPDGIEGVSVFTFPFISRDAFPDLGSRFRKFMERLSFGLRALLPLAKGGYDIIYIHKPYDLPVAILSSKISKARIVFGSGGTEFFPGYKCMVKKLDRFFACSEFNASQIEEYCGIRPMVLPNGIDTELFKPLPSNLKLKNKLQITDAEKVVISICRLVGWKGINYSIEAVAEIIKKGFTVKYLIIGDGEEKEKLKSLAKKLGIANNTLFLGGIRNSELPWYYSIADVAVFPSIANETFGISIAEAMSCGVPVVSTMVGGIPEVVAEGTGILVPPENSTSLAEAIEVLISDEAVHRKVSNAAREWIVKNFGWETVVEKFERYVNNA